MIVEGGLLGFSGSVALDFALATTTDGSAEGGDLVPEATRFAGSVEVSVEWWAAGMSVEKQK